MRFLLPLIAVLALVAPCDLYGQCPGGSCGVPQFSGQPNRFAPSPPDVPQFSGQPIQAARRVSMPNEIKGAVCLIHASGSRGSFRLTGTLVAKGNGSGLILTCAHGIRSRPTEITVLFPGQALSGELVAIHDSLDLSLIKTSGLPNAKPVSLSASFPRQGEYVVGAGYSGSNVLMASPGNVLHYSQNVISSNSPDNVSLVKTGYANSGDSGGPIFNAAWKLAAVTYGSDFSTTSMGTESQHAKRFLAQYRADCDERLAPRTPSPIEEPPPLADVPPRRADHDPCPCDKEHLAALESRIKQLESTVDANESMFSDLAKEQAAIQQTVVNVSAKVEQVAQQANIDVEKIARAAAQAAATEAATQVKNLPIEFYNVKRDETGKPEPIGPPIKVYLGGKIGYEHRMASKKP